MKKALVYMIFASAVFGTVGLFVSFVPDAVSRGFIALARCLVAFLFLALLRVFKRKKFSLAPLKKHPLLLPLSGAAMGINWVLIFMAYGYSVGKATLCYYMAPIFVILVSPFLFGERIGLKKGLCTLCAFVGMILVSGVTGEGFSAGEWKGVALALGAAVLYAAVMIGNKKMENIESSEKTFFEMGVAIAVLLVYVALSKGFPSPALFDFKTVALLLTLGLVHTGIAYTCWFAALPVLPAQTSSLLVYIDPVLTLILSALVLKEEIGVPCYIGALLILGAAAVSSIEQKQTPQKQL